MKAEDLKGLDKAGLIALRTKTNKKIQKARRGKKSDKALVAEKELILVELENRQGG